MMLFENLNYLLHERGAMPLSGEDFLALDPTQVWEIVDQLKVPFEILNSVNLSQRHALLKAKDLRLVVLDVDGVFTDGGMMYNSSGEETKKFNVKDGMGISRAVSKGMNFGIISAALRGEVVQLRAKMLGIQHVYVGKQPKLEVLEGWLYKLGIAFEDVAYIGDDVNDVAILKKVGIGACPSDAVPEAKLAADIVLQKAGGQGCIREFLEKFVLGDL